MTLLTVLLASALALTPPQTGLCHGERMSHIELAQPGDKVAALCLEVDNSRARVRVLAEQGAAAGRQVWLGNSSGTSPGLIVPTGDGWLMGVREDEKTIVISVDESGAQKQVMSFAGAFSELATDARRGEGDLCVAVARGLGVRADDPVVVKYQDQAGHSRGWSLDGLGTLSLLDVRCDETVLLEVMKEGSRHTVSLNIRSGDVGVPEPFGLGPVRSDGRCLASPTASDGIEVRCRDAEPLELATSQPVEDLIQFVAVRGEGPPTWMASYTRAPGLAPRSYFFRLQPGTGTLAARELSILPPSGFVHDAFRAGTDKTCVGWSEDAPTGGRIAHITCLSQ